MAGWKRGSVPSWNEGAAGLFLALRLRDTDVVGDPEPDEPAGGEGLGCREGDMECGSSIDDVEAFREEWRSVSIVLVLFRTVVGLGDTTPRRMRGMIERSGRGSKGSRANNANSLHTWFLCV
jgi:hypothetical protein